MGDCINGSRAPLGEVPCQPDETQRWRMEATTRPTTLSEGTRVCLTTMPTSLSDYCDSNKQSLGRETPSDFRFRYVDLSSVNEGAVDWHKTRPLSYANSPSRARRIVQPGDVLFSTVRPGLMGHAMVREPADLPIIGSTGFAVLSPKADADGRFLFHSLFLEEFNSRSPNLRLARVIPPSMSLRPAPGQAGQRRRAEPEVDRGHSRRNRRRNSEVE